MADKSNVHTFFDALNQTKLNTGGGGKIIQNTDENIFALLPLQNGHVTIHGFKNNNALMIDVFADHFFDIENIKDQLTTVYKIDSAQVLIKPILYDWETLEHYKNK